MLQEDQLNLTQIKKDLQTLGLSTATPGLTGEDRFEELKKRLADARQKFSGTVPTISQGQTKELPSIDQLSISEIRARLVALGKDTATPGVNGEERWKILKTRLVQAICGQEDTEEVHLKSQETNDTKKFSRPMQNRKAVRTNFLI
jgi:hypothetical protein